MSKVLSITATIALGLTLSACSSDGSAVVSEPTAPATTRAASSPAPVAITADAPVGTEVPLDQVDALRAAGAKVYVGTNDAGTVVAVGQPLPDAVVADIKAAAGPATAPQLRYSERRDDLTSAGLYVLVLARTGSDGTAKYIVRPASDIPGAKAYAQSIAGGSAHATKEAALAEMQPFIDATPGAVLVDLTD